MEKKLEETHDQFEGQEKHLRGRIHRETFGRWN